MRRRSRASSIARLVLLEPRVIAAGSDIENFAHGLNAVFGLMQFNEPVNLPYLPRARLRGHGRSLRWRILGHRVSTKHWELQKRSYAETERGNHSTRVPMQDKYAGAPPDETHMVNVYPPSGVRADPVM
jgi:hypothetical protein